MRTRKNKAALSPIFFFLSLPSSHGWWPITYPSQSYCYYHFFIYLSFFIPLVSPFCFRRCGEIETDQRFHRVIFLPSPLSPRPFTIFFLLRFLFVAFSICYAFFLFSFYWVMYFCGGNPARLHLPSPSKPPPPSSSSSSSS